MKNLKTSTKRIKKTKYLKTMKKRETKNSARCAKPKQDLVLKHNMNKRADSSQKTIVKKTEKTKKKETKMVLIKTRMMTMRVTIISDMLFVYLYSLIN